MSESKIIAQTIYRPNKKAKAVIQILHGMSEHRKRYEEFAQVLQNQGYVVVINDHRGHGDSVTSSEDYGYFDHEKGWQKVLKDVEEIMQKTKQEYPDIPYIMLGHSMGSLLARSFIKRYDSELDGLILSGAPNYNKLAPIARQLAKLIAAVKGDHYRSRLLDKMSFGAFNEKIASPRTKSDWISKNPDNVDTYLADPACGFVFTARGFEDLLYGMQDMHDLMRWNLKNPKLPILFVAGEDDPCTGGKKGLEDSEKTLREAGYSDIELRVFRGLRHEVLFEEEKEQVVKEILDWLTRKINPLKQGEND